MAPFRNATRNFGDLGKRAYKIRMLWSVLQQHRAMNDFVTARFHGHPTIVKIINMFVVTKRVDPAEVKALKTKVETLNKTVTSYQTRFVSMESSVAAYKRRLDNIENSNKMKGKGGNNTFRGAGQSNNEG